MQGPLDVYLEGSPGVGVGRRAQHGPQVVDPLDLMIPDQVENLGPHLQVTWDDMHLFLDSLQAVPVGIEVEQNDFFPPGGEGSGQFRPHEPRSPGDQLGHRTHLLQFQDVFKKRFPPREGIFGYFKIMEGSQRARGL